MRINRIKRVDETMTWERFGVLIGAGMGPDLFGVGSEITVHMEDIGEAILEVIGHDKDKDAQDPDAHTMTVQFRDLVLNEMQFDKDNCNKWEKSSLRKYLNSPEFKEKFEQGFRKLLTPVLKENDGREETLDTFFLLSVDEMKDPEKRYEKFKNEKDMIKVDEEGETCWYWTRSANRGNASNTWYVYASGYVYGNHAAGSFRFAPACVIKGIS